MSSNKKYQILINILLVILTLFMVLPILLLFMSSITEESTLIAKGYSFFPKKFSVEGYAYILKNKAIILSAYGYTIGSTSL